MLKKTLYLVAMALALAACEGMPTKVQRDVNPTLSAGDTVATQATPHGKRIEY